MTEHPFRIPQTMHDLTEQNTEHALGAHDQLTERASKTTSSWIGAVPARSMATNFKDVQDRAMDFAMDNAESAFTCAGKICSAQSIQEILTLQMQFAQERMQAFTQHTQELQKLIGQAFQNSERIRTH